MKVQLVTAPANEPVSLSDARMQLRRPIPGGEESHQIDNTLLDLIVVAREYVENITGRVLVTQTWDMWLDRWPRGDSIDIPKSPLQSITSLTYTDVEDTDRTLTEGTEFSVDTDSEPGRVVLDYDETWPTYELHPNNPINIRFVAGYTTVPAGIKHAIKLLVAHFDRNRVPLAEVRAGYALTAIPMGVDSLLAPYRMWGL